MNAAQPMTAEILEASSAGYAAAANVELQSRRGGGDSTMWTQHFQQRVLELATALRVGEPRLFARRVAWLRRAAAARGGGEAEIVLALECLRTALDKELPEHSRRAAVAVVELALREAKQAVPAEELALDPASEAGKLGLRYIAACLESDVGKAIELVMGAVAAGMRPEDVYCKVLLPVQKEVGQLWHAGDFSVAEERLVSETTRRLMSLVAARCTPRTWNGKTMLAASAPGNQHDMGLRVVADLYALAGWRCLFLGANVPAADIAGMVQEYGVHLAVLTATLTTQLNALSSTIAEINRVSPTTRVLVGGAAFEDVDGLWRHVGADGFAARVDEAVDAGEALLETAVVRGEPANRPGPGTDA